jgi:hypothetical protein
MNKIKYTHKQIVEALHKEEPAVVTFNKINGEERIMTCTLRKEAIPAERAPKGTGSEKLNENKNTIRAFDTNKQEWRSFRVDLVTKVE